MSHPLYSDSDSPPRSPTISPAPVAWSPAAKADPTTLPPLVPAAGGLRVPTASRPMTPTARSDVSETKQVVIDQAEVEGLISTIKRLEKESAALNHSLLSVCQDNERLTDLLDKAKRDVVTVRENVHGHSLLNVLFDVEAQRGWFGRGESKGGKEERAHLKEFCEQLQKEYIEYKKTHVATIDEVLSLTASLKSAHALLQHHAEVFNSSVGNKREITLSFADFHSDAGVQETLHAMQEVTQRVQAENNALNGQIKTLKVFESRSSELQEAARRLQAENSSMNAQIAALKAEAKASTDRVEAISTQAGASDARLFELQDTVRKLQSENAALNAQVTALKVSEGRASELQESSRQLQAENAAMNAQIAGLRAESQSHSKRAESLANQATAAETRFSELQDKFFRLQGENATLQSQIVTLRTEAQTHASRADQISNQAGALDARSSEMQEVIRRLQTENAVLTAQVATLKNFEVRSTESQETIRRLQAENAALNAQVAGLKAEHDSQVAQSSSRIKTMESQAAEAKRRMEEESATLYSRAHSAETQISELQDINRRLQNEVDTLRAQSESRARASSTSPAFESIVATKTKENDELRHQMSDLKNKLLAAENRAKLHESAGLDLKLRFESAAETEEVLRRQVQTLESLNTELKDTNRDLTKAADNYRRKIEALSHAPPANDATAARIRALESELAEARKTIEALRKQLEQQPRDTPLQIRASDSRTASNFDSQSEGTRVSETGDVEPLPATLAEAHDALRRTKAQLRVAVGRPKYDALKKKCESFEAQTRDLSRKCEVLETQVKMAQKYTATDKTTKVTSVKPSADHTALLDELQTSLDAITQERDALLQQLENAHLASTDHWEQIVREKDDAIAALQRTLAERNPLPADGGEGANGAKPKPKRKVKPKQLEEDDAQQRVEVLRTALLGAWNQFAPLFDGDALEHPDTSRTDAEIVDLFSHLCEGVLLKLEKPEARNQSAADVKALWDAFTIGIQRMANAHADVVGEADAFEEAASVEELLEQFDKACEDTINDVKALCDEVLKLQDAQAELTNPQPIAHPPQSSATQLTGAVRGQISNALINLAQARAAVNERVNVAVAARDLSDEDMIKQLLSNCDAVTADINQLLQAKARSLTPPPQPQPPQKQTETQLTANVRDQLLNAVIKLSQARAVVDERVKVTVSRDVSNEVLIKQLVSICDGAAVDIQQLVAKATAPAPQPQKTVETQLTQAVRDQVLNAAIKLAQARAVIDERAHVEVSGAASNEALIKQLVSICDAGAVDIQQLMEDLGGLEREKQTLQSQLVEAKKAQEKFGAESAQITKRVATLESELKLTKAKLDAEVAKAEQRTVSPPPVGANPDDAQATYLRTEVINLKKQLKLSAENASRIDAQLRESDAESVRRLRRIAELEKKLTTGEGLPPKPGASTNEPADIVALKTKLAEYQAVLDRIGLTYPFDQNLEASAKVRLKALGTLRR